MPAPITMAWSRSSHLVVAGLICGPLTISAIIGAKSGGTVSLQVKLRIRSTSELSSVRRDGSSSVHQRSTASINALRISD